MTVETEPPADEGARHSFAGPRIVGAAVLLLGLFVLAQSLEIGGSTGYSPVGPRFVPTIVGVGLVLLGIGLLIRTSLRPDADLGRQAASEERVTDWRTTGLVAAVLLAYALALAPLGYILATATFLPIAARILGSRNPVRDVVAGLLVGVVVWVGFTQLLGVTLPAGLLDPLLPRSG